MQVAEYLHLKLVSCISRKKDACADAQGRGGWNRIVKRANKPHTS